MTKPLSINQAILKQTRTILWHDSKLSVLTSRLGSQLSIEESQLFTHNVLHVILKTKNRPHSIYQKATTADRRQ